MMETLDREQLKREADARARLREKVAAERASCRPKARATSAPAAAAESPTRPELLQLEISPMKLLDTLAAPKASEEGVLLEQLGEVGAEIEMRLDDELQRERNEKNGGKPYEHPDWNWASQLGHPCARNLVYQRLNGAEQKVPDIVSLWRFREGNELEAKIKRQLSVIGYEIEGSQNRLRWEVYKISGRIDGLVPVGRRFPAPFENLRDVDGEIKSMNPLFWDKHKTIDDIKNSRYWWIRKYPSQLNLYCLMNDKPGGLLILGTFGKRPRILPMLVDYDLAERDLHMAEAVNRHVEAGTYPEPIPFEPSVCGMCEFNHICMPLKASPYSEISKGDYFELSLYIEAKAERDKAEQEFKRLHEKLIGNMKKPGRFYGANAILEDIEIESKEVDRKAYEVKAGHYTITTIERTTDR
jgi:hypothetical protein